MLPVVVVILPSYILAFRHFPPWACQTCNYSTIVGSVFYLVVMVILFATNHVSMVTLGLLTSATEVLIFCIVWLFVWHYRDRMRPDNRGRGEAT